MTRAAVAVALLVTLLAGCGSGDDEATGAGGEAGAEQRMEDPAARPEDEGGGGASLPPPPDPAAARACEDDTVVVGSADGSVIGLVGSSGVRIEGLHLTGGGGTTDGHSWSGGGISVDAGSSDVTIVGRWATTAAACTSSAT